MSVLGEGIAARRPEGLAGRREQIFQGLGDIRSHIGTVGQDELFALQIDGNPFWHIINGPLSDALTHTGQINSFRRLNGNGVPARRPFLCHQTEDASRCPQGQKSH
jgi:hypothetical protein